MVQVLTLSRRLYALGLLDGAIKELHLIERSLLPAIRVIDRNNFLAQGRNNLGVLSNTKQGLGEQISSGVNSNKGEGELEDGRVKEHLRVSGGKPIYGVI